MTIANELRLLWRDRATVATAILLAVLCAVAVANGLRWHREQAAARERSATAEREEYAARRADAAEAERHPPLRATPCSTICTIPPALTSSDRPAAA